MTARGSFGRFHAPVVLTRLPGGIRVVTAAMPYVRSVSFGVWMGVGARNESDPEAGASHFLEHLMFKGSADLDARELSESIEGVGGQINAFTSEEVTCCFAAVPSDRLPVVVHNMAEMFVRAACRRADIERERGVILDELALYKDQPQSVADETLNASLWPGHPLGRPVPGRRKSLLALKRRHLLAFRERHYLASNAVVAAAGDLDHGEVVRLVRREFGRLRSGSAPTPLPASAARRIRPLKTVSVPIEQTHLALGFITGGYHDRRRYALRILNVVLGENTSSRLFQKIREVDGLAYSVHSGVAQFLDTGAMTISASTDTANEDRVLRAVVRECGKMARTGPTADELRRARDYVIGQARMGLESTVHRMTWVGEHLLMYDHIQAPSAHEALLAKVTVADVRDLAGDIFRQRNAALVAVGPGVDGRRQAYIAALDALER